MTPIQCTNVVPGWRLHFCRLRAEPGGHDDTLRLAIGGTLAAFHGRFKGQDILSDPVVKAVRVMFEASGIDPGAHAPSSEVLARRILDGEPFPRGGPADDLCSLLMLKTMGPWSATDYSLTVPPFRYAEVADGSMRGWPGLFDADRLVAGPVAGQTPGRVGDADEVLLTCFQPAGFGDRVAARVHLGRLVVLTWAFKFVEEKSVAPPG